MLKVAKHFLGRGFQVYRDAQRTIDHFEKSVQATSTEVFKQHLADLSQALGIELRPTNIGPFTKVWPEGAWVAAVISCPAPLWKIRVGAPWDVTAEGSDKAFAAVDLACWHVTVGERLRNRLVESPKPGKRYEIQDEQGELWTQAELPPDDAMIFRSLLDEQLLEWTARLREIGGIRSLEAG